MIGVARGRGIEVRGIGVGDIGVRWIIGAMGMAPPPMFMFMFACTGIGIGMPGTMGMRGAKEGCGLMETVLEGS